MLYGELSARGQSALLRADGVLVLIVLVRRFELEHRWGLLSGFDSLRYGRRLLLSPLRLRRVLRLHPGRE